MNDDLSHTCADGKPFPIITCNAADADNAWQVHVAMRQAQERDPTLADNPLWRVMTALAYQVFEQAFEAL